MFRFAMAAALLCASSSASAAVFTFSFDVDLFADTPISGRADPDFATPFTIVPGDTLDITFNLNTPFVVRPGLLLRFDTFARLATGAIPAGKATSTQQVFGNLSSTPAVRSGSDINVVFSIGGIPGQAGRAPLQSGLFVDRARLVATYDLGPAIEVKGASFTITSVPEPATWAFMLAGFGLTGAVVRQGTKLNSSKELLAHRTHPKGLEGK
jgi:hypothetical protein